MNPCLRASLLIACGAIAAGCSSGSAAVCGDTADEQMACVEPSRLAADVATIAHERVPGSAHWQAVQDLCRDRLTASGYQVTLDTYATGVNVIGRRAGTSAMAGDVIVSAHYDHIPGCNGADDNASGLAATLEIARVLATSPHADNLVIACWDEEERGLLGSKSYAERAQARGDVVHAMIAFDAIGFASSEPNSQLLPAGFDVLFYAETAAVVANEYRGDFIASFGDQESATTNHSLELHGAAIGLPTVVAKLPGNLKLAPETADLRRSDHASFWTNGYPGLFITDTANFRNHAYHCFGGTHDEPESLDMAFLAKVTRAALGAVFDTLTPAGS